MLSKPKTADVKELVSNDIAIQVSGVGKCYYAYDKPLHRLWHAMSPESMIGKPFWALKDVSLNVNKGETVGLIGKNGSGKSTLLQVITGILEPTKGACEVNGRISALLELGAGFNPEFTGIENARLNASIMGLSDAEFETCLPDIIEFSALGDFLYRPVKTYSSGMYVRLAFAVAINMEPDILIVDEALAVGDIRFQTKCFRRLDQLKEKGVSILFVTHSTDSVLKYCDQAVLLNEGEILDQGEPKAVVQKYLELMFESDVVASSKQSETQQGDSPASLIDSDKCKEQKSYNQNEQRWGDQRASIVDYQLLINNHMDSHCKTGDTVRVLLTVQFYDDVDGLVYGLTVKTTDGVVIYGTNTRVLQSSIATQQRKDDTVKIAFDFDVNLIPNDYFISVGVAQDHDEKDVIAVDRRYDMIHLPVLSNQENIGGEGFGIAALAGRVSAVK